MKQSDVTGRRASAIPLRNTAQSCPELSQEHPKSTGLLQYDNLYRKIALSE
jgi:hypothetical protein